MNKRTHYKKEFGFNEKEIIGDCLLKNMLSEIELERYSRQIKELGVEKQEELKDKAVLQIGAGGLGSPLALYLAAAGIGHLKIIDYDNVSLSNLNRQILYKTDDVDKQKHSIVKKKLKAFNPEIKITTINAKVNYENFPLAIEDVDYLVDASDNLFTKFLVNDMALTYNVPCTIAGVQSMEGQIMSINPHKSACYRCVFGDTDANDKDHEQKQIDTMEKQKRKDFLGILGFTCGVVGSLEAAEVVKGLIDTGNRLLDTLLMIDLSEMKFARISLSRDDTCKCSDIN